MNKVILQGNLGFDPELRAREGKVTVCTFNLATNENVRGKDGKAQDVTEWHRIVTFGKTAELCAKYLKKGDSALLEGKISSSKFTTKEGKEQTSFSIIADSVRFLSKRAPRPVESSLKTDTADDIPF